jgi:Zn ribbon nucleic-acid-binding protein
VDWNIQTVVQPRGAFPFNMATSPQAVDEDDPTNLTRVKTMIFKGRARQHPTDDGEHVSKAIFTLCSRTREDYEDILLSHLDSCASVGAHAPSGQGRRPRLQSLALPAFNGEGEGPLHFASGPQYSAGEKLQLLEEQLLANAEVVDCLPGISERMNTEGVKIIRVYYRQCLACGHTKPVGLFPEGEFTCADCT